jgi:hypothetical protein
MTKMQVLQQLIIRGILCAFAFSSHHVTYNVFIMFGMCSLGVVMGVIGCLCGDTIHNTRATLLPLNLEYSLRFLSQKMITK